MESFQIFTLFYIWFIARFLYPPPEFVSLGLTVESIFSSFLKEEFNSFIHYHVKRITFTFMTHSFIPFVYVLVTSYMFPEWTVENEYIPWKIVVAISLLPPTVCALIVWSWYQNSWRKHPVAKRLEKFITEENGINQIKSQIDNEYRSVDKVVIKCTSVTTIIATNNWLIKVSPYDLCVAHQDEVSLVVTSSNQSQGRPIVGDYLNIDIKSRRPNVKSFQIRLNAAHLQELQDKISTRINVGENIIIQQSLTDRFVSVFKEHVMENPKIIVSEALGLCIGCMQTAADVRLRTSCGYQTGPDKCTTCSCPPLWCVDCMGKWFASRQDQEKPDTWLSAKCTCPMCRSVFCVLDVCPVVRNAETENIENN